MLGRFGKALAFATVFAAADAQACAFHVIGVGGFDLAYPGSLRVAMAVAEAKADGELQPASLPEGDEGLNITSGTLKDLGEHPDRGGAVAIMDGKYGPYVKWEKVNATLPDNTEPDTVTMELAMQLIEEREAKSGKKKTTRKKKAS